MQKINNFIEIEKLIYDNPISRELRFTNICAHSTGDIFYYDCLLPEVVLLERVKVLRWKEGHLRHDDFPVSNVKNIHIQLQPPFQKYPWTEAVKKSKELIIVLEGLLLNQKLHKDLFQDIEFCIENIKNFFNSGVPENNLAQTHNLDDYKKDIFTFSENFKSPQLFQEFKFSNKHTDNVYLLLEKIFSNFNLFSKYKMSETHIQAKKIDEYLYNHMKNIYFSKDFSMIDLETETVSILNKINNYLVIEIDRYLEQCIENQISIIDSIHQKFNLQPS